MTRCILVKNDNTFSSISFYRVVGKLWKNSLFQMQKKITNGYICKNIGPPQKGLPDKEKENIKKKIWKKVLEIRFLFYLDFFFNLCSKIRGGAKLMIRRFSRYVYINARTTPELHIEWKNIVFRALPLFLFVFVVWKGQPRWCLLRKDDTSNKKNP